uniref:Uncharacterized protein n=1 Tax=Trichuris muris TaxID=70415 RepID=A0A5S6Q5Q5_TRIMR
MVGHWLTPTSDASKGLPGCVKMLSIKTNQSSKHQPLLPSATYHSANVWGPCVTLVVVVAEKQARQRSSTELPPLATAVQHDDDDDDDGTSTCLLAYICKRCLDERQR